MNRTNVSRALAVAFLSTSLFTAAVPAFSQDHSHSGAGPLASQMTDADRAKMLARMQTGMKRRLDRMATRLEIKPAQQDAWTAYRTARESIFTTPPQFPPAGADAATIARFRADMAKHRADYMATVADATAKLQEVLEPNQRKVLDEMSRRGDREKGQRGSHGSGMHRGHTDAPQPR
jgi:hypothetical protein